ncbi:hypothetical protein B0T10DRAFT_488084 [Thelonectria olida]|uniref:Heterokaryon incompatibility domain-containing protein n=1 Tax=Thelonectria olida TaxID=1576542 RepID=A0A9P8W553_9HYPO|nr:hypothetical protein B0T10DRAFT_488084 [Thelonectria olida]
MTGYTKIVQTCPLVQTHGLEYAWVDTCCIDKSSSTELTEFINSMFTWYKNAYICYVSLVDLEPKSSVLGACLWFTRAGRFKSYSHREDLTSMIWPGIRLDPSSTSSIPSQAPLESPVWFSLHECLSRKVLQS